MKLALSSYYKHANLHHQQIRLQSDKSLQNAIETVLSEWPQYGYRRVTIELHRRGILVNHKRVSRVMRENQLNVKPRARHSKHSYGVKQEPAYPNLAKGFNPTGPNQLWVGDITYIRLRSGFVYLAVLIDAWSRRVVGYSVSSTMETSLTLSALNAAVETRYPATGLIHHTDRGSQYISCVYQQRLAELGIKGSMSRPATPTDNAKAESFMKTLKYEEIYALEYETHRDVRIRLPHFIDEIYNKRRIHSALNYLTPIEFEEFHAQQGVN
jgi:putative transposase